MERKNNRVLSQLFERLEGSKEKSEKGKVRFTKKKQQQQEDPDNKGIEKKDSPPRRTKIGEFSEAYIKPLSLG